MKIATKPPAALAALAALATAAYARGGAAISARKKSRNLAVKTFEVARSGGKHGKHGKYSKEWIRYRITMDLNMGNIGKQWI